MLVLRLGGLPCGSSYLCCPPLAPPTLTDAGIALTTEQTAHTTDNTNNEAIIADLTKQVADLTAQVASLTPTPTPDVAPTDVPLPDNTQAS